MYYIDIVDVWVYVKGDLKHTSGTQVDCMFRNIFSDLAYTINNKYKER